MDYFAEALALMQLTETLTATAGRMIAAAKEAGDPTPDAVKAQMDASKAANDRLHALLNG